MTSDMQSSNTKPTPSRRRRLKFSLRSLLVFITLVACFLSWIVYERSQSKFERQIGKKLQEQGCGVEFHGIYDKKLSSGEFSFQRTRQGWWRDLARQFLGERIWFIWYRGEPENLLLLAELKNLEAFAVIETPIDDLTQLADCNNLKQLYLKGMSLDDLTPLAGSNLKFLYLRGTIVKDEQVESLRQALPNCIIRIKNP